MKVEISITHRQRILDHARSSRTEVCGLLLGDGERITEVERCANVSSEPATRFELDPVALIAAWRAARTGGHQVIGHYHSHPTGDPRPSLTDAADAAPDGALWIIVGASEMAAWRAVERGALHGRFDPVELIVTAG